jgi:hypothetical protein
MGDDGVRQHPSQTALSVPRGCPLGEVPVLRTVALACRREDVIDQPRPDGVLVGVAPGLVALGRSREAGGARELST